MKSETCFSTGKIGAACFVILTILTATNFFKLWVCPSLSAQGTEIAEDREKDPIQEGSDLDSKMDRHSELLLDLHDDMDAVNSNLTEIQVLLRED